MRQSRGVALAVLALGVLTTCGNRARSTGGTVQPAEAGAGEAGAPGGPAADAGSDSSPPGPVDPANDGSAAGGAGGAGPGDVPSLPSAPLVIGLLPATDPTHPFQHAAEVSVAAHGADVVVSAINIHTDGAGTLEAADLFRQIGVAVSHDGGNTFGEPALPGFTSRETSDPVVRVTRDGSFWLAAIGIDETGNKGLLLRSRDGGRGFASVHDDLTIYDKEWMAASPGGGLVLGGEGGLWRFDQDGLITASWADGFDWTVFGAFDDEQGAHFSTDHVVYRWAGDAGFAEGVHQFQDHDPSSGWSAPKGRAASGELWTVYGSAPRLDASGVSGDVRLALYSSDSDLTGTTIPISTPFETAFMPAAAQDDDGRVHVIWYDSSGAAGVLKYARSASADLRDGFLPPTIVDTNACPGGRWYPVFGESDEAPDDRRLREYVDLSISGRRVHMAWTHAPELPSRILVSHLDF